jgi:hypothetical protein
MGRGRKRAARPRARRRRRGAVPIPLEPVELLAGLAPGVVLGADELPAALAAEVRPVEPTTTVAEVGKLLRGGDTTVRRLIRGQLVTSAGAPASPGEPARAGVLRRTPERPGE